MTAAEIADLIDRFGVSIMITIFFLVGLVAFFGFLGAVSWWLLHNAVKPVVQRHLKFVDAMELTIVTNSTTAAKQAENASQVTEMIGRIDTKVNTFADALHSARCRMS